jgi:uncharacterized lipoprotein YddW (UPF0748 family)
MNAAALFRLPRLARILVALFLLSFAFNQSSAQTPEYRGFWVDAWGSELWNSGNITKVVNDTRAGNMNLIVAQARRRGDALYNSKFEPKCKDIAGAFDPLADLIVKGHNTNAGPYVEVHAWVVTYHIHQGTTAPTQPSHPLNLHPDWLLKDINGNLIIGNEYTFDPGHPEVQKHTFNVCMDIVTNYNVDGLNFDYIRYSSTSEGYNDVTVARFNKRFNRIGTPSTSDAVWKQFRRDQVTGLLRKIYLNAIAVRPEVKISCDTITWAPGPTSDSSWYSSAAAWNSVLQDWRGWMEEGILDINIPMNYFRQTANAADYVNWSNFAKDHRFNRQVIIGPGIYLNSVADTILQLRQARQVTSGGNSADGSCGYSFRVTNKDGVSRANYLGALTSASVHDPLSPPVFAQAVPTPTMTWKTAPTKGHLKGFAYGGGLTNPLDGVKVTLTGPLTRAQTNDATGFYGFVDLAPGVYTVAASFAGFIPVSSNVTISAGTVATADLVLPAILQPLITSQPQSASVLQGNNALFNVGVSGTAPLAYQWRWYGTNLPGATGSNLLLSAVAADQSGPYTAVITNAYGAITSSIATLTISLPPPPGKLSMLWNVAPGSRSYLAINALPTERGLAYNPISGRLVLLSRAGSSLHAYVLSAETGADLHELNVSGITGGTYALSLVGVADDGAVYAANLTTSGASSPFKIYRWANDDPGTVPTLAYAGDPSPGNPQRWGDTFDVRGAGPTTQLIAGSRASTNVVLFTTLNGSSYTAQNLVVPAIANGDVGLGLAFSAGNTFWGKANGRALRQIAFNPATGSGTVLRTHADPQFPNSITAIGVNDSLKLLAGVSITSPNHLRLYELPAGPAHPTLVATNLFPADNDNTGAGTGAVDFHDDRVYALDSNNGLLALKVNFSPSIIEQPHELTLKAGNSAFFSVIANGTTPLAYQWTFNGVPVPEATSNSYRREGVLTNSSGFYSVVITNGWGSITSTPALLTVIPPLNPHLNSVALSPEGPVQISGAGDPGDFVIEASENLADWQMVGMVSSTNGLFQWWDPETTLPRRFYRVSWQP